jgi:hypothetical protein
MRNTLKSDYKVARGKMKEGPGGWHCNCCNPYDCHPRKMKPLARRRLRRILKQNLGSEATND